MTIGPNPSNARVANARMRRPASAAARLGVSVERYEAERAAGRAWCWWERAFVPIKSFGVDHSRPDGRNRICRSCAARRGRELAAQRRAAS